MQRDELWWPNRDELADLALGDGLWDAYCVTHVRIWLPQGAVVVRPCEVPGRSDPPAGPLHVVTACDPGSAGRREDDDVRMQLLAAELCGLDVYPAVGADAAGEHSETSLAVADRPVRRGGVQPRRALRPGCGVRLAWRVLVRARLRR